VGVTDSYLSVGLVGAVLLIFWRGSMGSLEKNFSSKGVRTPRLACTAFCRSLLEFLYIPLHAGQFQGCCAAVHIGKGEANADRSPGFVTERCSCRKTSSYLRLPQSRLTKMLSRTRRQCRAGYGIQVEGRGVGGRFDRHERQGPILGRRRERRGVLAAVGRALSAGAPASGIYMQGPRRA